MNAKLLLTHYDRVADAPDAINRLRRFVFDLAVRGKLVEQDPADEPVDELLKRIAAEKVRMITAKEIRKPRRLQNARNLMESFKIPKAWRWCHLDTVGAIIGGGTPFSGDPANFAKPGEGIPWITPRDLGGHKNLYIQRGSRDLSKRGLQSSSATLMPKGTVLFSSRAPIGYVAIASNPVSTNQGFKSIVPYVSECCSYIALTLKTFGPAIEADAPSTTFKEISGKIVAGISIPLPPLAEQHRIVAKVNELMTLCDQLEEAHKIREGTREKLTKASLIRLSAPDPDERTFHSHVRFAVDSLPVLTARVDQIKHLRKVILNLAVRGKLVKQDPTDEPASELLRRIADEKAQMVNARKTRGPKIVATSNNPAFLVPENWYWAQVREVTSDRGQKVPDSPFTYVDVSAIDKENGSVAGPRVLQPDEAPSRARKIAYLGDVIYSCVRPYLLNIAVIEDIFNPPLIVSTAFEVLNGHGFVLPRYIWIVLRSPFIVGCVEKHQRGQAYPAIKSAEFSTLPIPLPPLTEQHRIVTKVDELMSLCDQLEARVVSTNEIRTRLLESCLYDTLASTAHEAIDTTKL